MFYMKCFEHEHAYQLDYHILTIQDIITSTHILIGKLLQQVCYIK